MNKNERGITTDPREAFKRSLREYLSATPSNESPQGLSTRRKVAEAIADVLKETPEGERLVEGLDLILEAAETVATQRISRAFRSRGPR
ncbi:hypothetical protein C4559_06035 [Candidatus Microgenomates bacterium]|nr:MAG: hypothetical protein C4559_06035 [Candidatus Microgenomates bacterium]